MATVTPKRITPMPPIGCDMFHFALMTEDDKSAGFPLYDTPERVPGLKSVAPNPNAQSATDFADNGPYAAAVQLGEQTIIVGLEDVPPDIRAIWFGQEYRNGVLFGTQIAPPDIAVGYRIKNATGGYRYFWYLKCKAAPPSETVNTQGGSISFQSGTITITCVFPVSCNGAYLAIDDNDPNLPEGITRGEIADKWFTDPKWAFELLGELEAA